MEPTRKGAGAAKLLRAAGMALLAAYALHRAEGETLASYLHNRVFANAPRQTLAPDETDAAGFAAFLARYREALEVERTAVEKV